MLKVAATVDVAVTIVLEVVWHGALLKPVR
jgi:hypothetical protein